MTRNLTGIFMKYIVVLGDGMADRKIAGLGNKTCLEAAATPTIDKLAPVSEIGLCKTVPEGFKPGSDVANMSVLGFAPQKYYTGRSPLEAVSMGIKLAPTDVTVRCNLVTLSDETAYNRRTTGARQRKLRFLLRNFLPSLPCCEKRRGRARAYPSARYFRQKDNRAPAQRRKRGNLS